MASQAEIERRGRAIRDALCREGVDALVVSGSEYTGFDGAVLPFSQLVDAADQRAAALTFLRRCRDTLRHTGS